MRTHRSARPWGAGVYRQVQASASKGLRSCLELYASDRPTDKHVARWLVLVCPLEGGQGGQGGQGALGGVENQ